MFLSYSSLSLQNLIGSSYDTGNSSSAASSSRLVFHAVRSLSLSATVFLVLLLLLLFELELVDDDDSFLGEKRRRAEDFEGDFVAPLLLCFC